MLTVVESSASADRVAAAVDFVWSFPRGTELLLIGPTRGAVDDLVQRLSLDAGASFGWHRFTLAQLAAVLAAPFLAAEKLTHTSTLGTTAIVARALHEVRRRKQLSHFEPVASFPGFAPALAATLSELRLANVTPSAVAGVAPAASELALVLKEFVTQLRNAGVADRAQILHAATKAARARVAPIGAPLLLFDLAIDTAQERDFVSALTDAAPETLATLTRGDRRTHEFLHHLGGAIHPIGEKEPDERISLDRLRLHLFDPAPQPEHQIDESVVFFSAPGEQRECVEIARWMIREAERGVRFDEMAVFLRRPERYALLLDQALQRAKIPTFLARGTARPDPAGRAFLALLRCRAEGLSARRFAEYLSLGEVPRQNTGTPAETWVAPRDEILSPLDGGPNAAPTSGGDVETDRDTDKQPILAGSLRAPWHWEDLLVEAAVIGGRARWERRLVGLQAQLRARLAEVDREDPDGSAAGALRADIERLGHLTSFALPIIQELDNFPEFAVWGEWLDALTILAPRTLRQSDRVAATLAELRSMAGMGPVGIEEVIAVLSERLGTLEEDPPASRFGRVFIAPPEDARGRLFRVVFVPGLAEGIFPKRTHEDPILNDALRQKIAVEIATQDTRTERERRQLHLAVGAASERLYLSYPRVEVVEGRARVPSFYALDVERAITGQVRDFEAFERQSAQTVDARLAWPAPRDAARAIDDIEHDLAVLGYLLEQTSIETRGRARYLLELNESLGRSLRSRWYRWEHKAWTPADGFVRAPEPLRPLLEKYRLRSRPYSPTSLQRFAACPYQFYLSTILGLHPREQPARIERMDPLTRGQLMHKAQAEVLRALQRERITPLAPARLARAESVLDRVLDRAAERFRDELAPAIERVWHDEVESVRTDLRIWLQRLASESQEWQPAHCELGFGLPRREDLDPRSTRDPVRVCGNYLLRGAIDLVEKRASDNHLRVLDHKTGVDRTPPDFIIAGGTILQPLLYGLATEEIFDSPVWESLLSFCTAAGGFAVHTVAMDDLARQHAQQALELIDRAVETGLFPPAPRSERNGNRESHACDFCEFIEVCGPHEPQRSRKKDPRPLDVLTTLRRLP